MGHQINFFAVSSDVSMLQNALAAVEPMAIVAYRSSAPSPTRVDSLLTQDESGRIRLFYFLARDAELEHLHMQHIQAQNHWVVDSTTSPAIEFSGCYSDGQILRRGRLYYKDGYYGANEQWIEKSLAFRSWAKSVFRVARGALLKHNGDYIGPDALNAVKKGALTLTVL